MTIDASELRGEIAALEAQVTRLRRIVDDGEPDASGALYLEIVGLKLPSEIALRRPAEIAGYLRRHTELIPVVNDMASALLGEFVGESTEIELVLNHDPDVDDLQVTFIVRAATYDDSFVPRLDKIWEKVDGQYPPTPEWVLVTTDYRPLSA